MATLLDKVTYFTPEEEDKPSEAIAGLITAFDSDGAVILLMGNRKLGFVTAGESPEPTPGCYVVMA